MPFLSTGCQPWIHFRQQARLLKRRGEGQRVRSREKRWKSVLLSRFCFTQVLYYIQLGICSPEDYAVQFTHEIITPHLEDHSLRLKISILFQEDISH